MARISSIVFDGKERPKLATIITSTGTVKVEGRDVCGDWCWMTSGNFDAKKLAGSASERIQKMIQVLD